METPFIQVHVTLGMVTNDKVSTGTNTNLKRLIKNMAFVLKRVICLNFAPWETRQYSSLKDVLSY